MRLKPVTDDTAFNALDFFQCADCKINQMRRFRETESTPTLRFLFAICAHEKNLSVLNVVSSVISFSDDAEFIRIPTYTFVLIRTYLSIHNKSSVKIDE